MVRVSVARLDRIGDVSIGIGGGSYHRRRRAEILTALGERIKGHRLALGWTRNDLADETDMSADALVKIEAGRCEPRSVTLAMLAQALGVTMDDLYYGSEGSP